MKYLKYFEQASAFEAYKNGIDYVLPNVSYVVELDSVDYNPYVPAPQKAGDIVYYVDGNLKTVPYASYNASMGTAVGVIVIPKGFAPDGKARMVSLMFATSTGTSSDWPSSLKWGPYNIDTTLTNYTKVPITDNVGSTITGSDADCLMPSDNDIFSGLTSVLDPEAKYYSTDSYGISWGLSPYLNGVANPDYYGAIEGYNNALSDFNGLGNTATLVGLGSDYAAANAANNYSDGVSGAKWYLPAMGELGYLIARTKEINNAIAAAGGVALPTWSLWSSTENNPRGAYYSDITNGYVKISGKGEGSYVRPFAIVE